MVRAELEGLATEIAAQRIDGAGLEELVAAERRFHRLTNELRSREPGRDRRSIMADWVRANHAFHDVIYRIAEVPYVERIAKSARRTFSGPAVWAPGGEELEHLYAANDAQHRSIRQALAAGSPSGARALARDHVLSSFKLLEAILDQVGAWPQEWHARRPARPPVEWPAH